MKKQLKLILLFSFSLVIFSFYSCSENNVTETENTQITFSSHQITGCNNSGLLKTTNEDSCFAYSFNDALKIDFCVVGNCCPDSQRFISDYNISSDTIFVSVADTAANLCYCICNYTIHVELLGLTKDKYLFVCDYPSDYANLNYLERVSK
jgi:hypothetical protein